MKVQIENVSGKTAIDVEVIEAAGAAIKAETFEEVISNLEKLNLYWLHYGKAGSHVWVSNFYSSKRYLLITA